jgi:hypothetical protein
MDSVLEGLDFVRIEHMGVDFHSSSIPRKAVQSFLDSVQIVLNQYRSSAHILERSSGISADRESRRESESSV